jgi:hypothetical protein
MTKRALTEEDYALLLEWQGGVCAICRRAPRPGARLLAVDHHHKSGEVRGLLCSACNVWIGLVGEDSEWLRNAAEYLEWPPSRDCWLGLPRWWPGSPGEAGHDLRNE